jgi:hypothetical protein
VKEGRLNIISPKEFYKEICEESIVFAVVANEIVKDFLEEPPEEVREVLKEFLVFSLLNYLMFYPLCMMFNTP